MVNHQNNKTSTSVKRGARKSKPTRPSQPQRQRGNNGGMVIKDPAQDCLINYAKSLLNPFDAPPACIPVTPSIDSLKLKVFARGTCATGTQGFGFVVTRPDCANNNTCVSHST